MVTNVDRVARHRGIRGVHPQTVVRIRACQSVLVRRLGYRTFNTCDEFLLWGRSHLLVPKHKHGWRGRTAAARRCHNGEYVSNASTDTIQGALRTSVRLWYYTTNKEEYNQMTIYYCCSFVIHVRTSIYIPGSRKASTKTTDIRQEHYAAVHHDNSSHDTEVLASYICTVSTSTLYVQQYQVPDTYLVYEYQVGGTRTLYKASY